MSVRKLILRCPLATGDIVMLTAAVRDLHQCYPGEYVTDVRTYSPALWDHNPYLTSLDEAARDVRVLDCDYPLINRADREPYHCLHGFLDFLNHRLRRNIRPTAFRGDIHLSLAEKSYYSQVHELVGRDIPFWIIDAGGKYDMTVKWWDAARYQAVVDHFRDRIQFIQVGGVGHHHPRLDGVIDLRGKTDLRQLVRLVYHAQGIVGPVTALMHLAAAVEMKGEPSTPRPCVVIAGGREPPHWETYPGHQFIHTIGALPCCQASGCWKARAFPLGDGSYHDEPKHLCLDVAGALPRCMDLITAAEVIQRIELYFAGGRLRNPLTPAQAEIVRPAVAAQGENPFDHAGLNEHNVRMESEKRIRALPSYPGQFQGRGIVICGGGVTHFTGAWVCIKMLRQHGCRLPIEVWHLGEREFDARMRELLTPLGVECVDAQVVRRQNPVRYLGGWELKPFALLYSSFREVLLLDADNVPIADPTYLFDQPEFQSAGAVFWPDLPRGGVPKRVWDFCGIDPPDRISFETGQILVDKKRCWRPLNLALWYNEHSDFFYQHLLGDKETFHLAFRKLNQPYAMPGKPVERIWGTMCQHDFEGKRLFQHRNRQKWTLFRTNPRIRGFQQEADCLNHLENLRQQWDGRMDRYESQLRINEGGRERSPHSGNPPSCRLIILSIGNRPASLDHTLRSLQRTDWPDEPMVVRVNRPPQTAFPVAAGTAIRKAMIAAIEATTDYVVLVEHDTLFNRHLWHNLQRWAPLRDAVLQIGALSTATAKPQAGSVDHDFFVADPYSIHGGTCWILERHTILLLLDRWHMTAERPDTRIGRLAAEFGIPVLCHAPSLTQRASSESPWPGSPARAVDYSWRWKT